MNAVTSTRRAGDVTRDASGDAFSTASAWSVLLLLGRIQGRFGVGAFSC
jgi:hypothetical protein